MQRDPVVTRHAEVVSGTPVFAGTRVPVQNLVDYLEGDDVLDEFLDNFPSVTREQANRFLNEALAHMLANTPQSSASE